ncbi:MAG: 3'(2'),5'-bisphosphate nucleotidase CysQ [Pseudomonadota bacterium]
MPANDLALLTEAALAAGDIARRHWNNAPRIWNKPGDAGPVTEADCEVNEMLRDVLLTERPGHGWLSEESPDTPERLAAEKTFIIDPIDGTRAFIAGQDIFAHSLAIAERGSITTAVVYLPIRDLLYTAALGAGAMLNGRPLSAAHGTELAGARVLGTKSNFENRHWKGGVPPVSRHFRASLAYRLCLVAQSRFDAMITLRDCWEWDVAAGDLIVREAGGRSTDRRGATLHYNNPHPKRPGLLAGGPRIHQALLGRLKQV